MKNLYEIMENTSKEEKMWACMKVELNELRKNPDNFGMSEIDIISEYFGMNINSNEIQENNNAEVYIEQIR